MKALWLVRTHDNKISGPLTADEVRAQVLSRSLALQDELCSSEGYWFFLHEAEELQTQLGVQYPPRARDREATDTETQTASQGKVSTLPDRTDPDFRRSENVHVLPSAPTGQAPLGWVAQGAAKASSSLLGATVAPPNQSLQAEKTQTVPSGLSSTEAPGPAVIPERKDSGSIDAVVKAESAPSGFSWVAVALVVVALAGAALVFWSRSR
jgi:hypothetical protein